MMNLTELRATGDAVFAQSVIALGPQGPRDRPLVVAALRQACEGRALADCDRRWIINYGLSLFGFGGGL